MNYKSIFQTVISGIIFTIICISLVVFIADISKNKIIKNEKQNLINELNQLVDGFDNNILEDAFIKKLDLYSGQQSVTVYPAKKNGKIFARLIKHIYPKGYSGNIVLLTAINSNNKIIGSRVLKHSETPGLGDKIEIKKSSWMLSFNDIGLSDVVWKVKKNGGSFDSWSGATITPSAIIVAIEELLQAVQNGKL